MCFFLLSKEKSRLGCEHVYVPALNHELFWVGYDPVVEKIQSVKAVMNENLDILEVDGRVCRVLKKWTEGQLRGGESVEVEFRIRILAQRNDSHNFLL